MTLIDIEKLFENEQREYERKKLTNTNNPVQAFEDAAIHYALQHAIKGAPVFNLDEHDKEVRNETIEEFISLAEDESFTLYEQDDDFGGINRQVVYLSSIRGIAERLEEGGENDRA